MNPGGNELHGFHVFLDHLGTNISGSVCQICLNHPETSELFLQWFIHVYKRC